MNRQEFLSTLRQTLAGEVSTDIVNENMNYYNEYIVNEVRKGRTEPEVMQSLGDPRLIAKTIIDTQGVDDVRSSYVYEEPPEEKIYEEGSRRMIRLPGWATLILIVVAACVVTGVIGSIIASLLPVLIPLILILYLIRVIRMFRR